MAAGVAWLFQPTVIKVHAVVLSSIGGGMPLLGAHLGAFVVSTAFAWHRLGTEM